MKLGCSSWSYHAAFRAGQIDLLEFLRVCGEELELDGVELVDLHFQSTDPAYLRQVKKQCVDLHLTIAGLAVSNDFGSRERRDAERQKVQQWCDVAAYLGAPIVRVFAGWVPPPEPPRNDGRIVGLLKRIVGPAKSDPRRNWSDIAETLRQCADYAAERGVVLALQNSLSDGIIGTPPQITQIVRDVGSPWLKVCLDPADLRDGTGVDAALPMTVQAHARMREVSDDGSDARIAWPLLLPTLALGRYRGFLLLDYEGVEPPETAVPRAVRYLRGLLYVLGRQQVLTESASEPQPNSASAFSHPDLAPDAVTDAIAHVRGDVLTEIIRAIIFDLGRTLWDILPDQSGALDAAYGAVHATLLERLEGGVPEPQALRDAVSAALREDADTYFMAGHILEQPPSHTWVERGCKALGLHLDEALLREITIPLFATEVDRLSVMPGTIEAVTDLKRRGLALGCVTNTLTDQGTIESMIEKYGFGGLFDTVIVSTEMGYRKPHPSLFEAAARDVGLANHEALFVGDSPYHDIGGAKAVGMRAALTRQYATRPSVDGVPAPDAVIDHVSELPKVVRKLSTTR